MKNRRHNTCQLSLSLKHNPYGSVLPGRTRIHMSRPSPPSLSTLVFFAHRRRVILSSIDMDTVCVDPTDTQYQTSIEVV